MDSDLQEISRVMASVLTPVFLISGVSALIGPMTLRYGRVIDRVRFLLAHSEQRLLNERLALHWELEALYARAKLLRFILICAIIAIAFMAMTILSLFAGFMFHLGTARAAVWLFGTGLSVLIFAVALFMRDFTLSLKVLKVDVETRLKDDLMAADGS